MSYLYYILYKIYIDLFKFEDDSIDILGVLGVISVIIIFSLDVLIGFLFDLDLFLLFKLYSKAWNLVFLFMVTSTTLLYSYYRLHLRRIEIILRIDSLSKNNRIIVYTLGVCYIVFLAINLKLAF